MTNQAVKGYQEKLEELKEEREVGLDEQPVQTYQQEQFHQNRSENARIKSALQEKGETQQNTDKF